MLGRRRGVLVRRYGAGRAVGEAEGGRSRMRETRGGGGHGGVWKMGGETSER